MFEYINKMNSRFPTQIIEFKKRPRQMGFEIQVLAWDMDQQGLSPHRL
jgi:hypothetical protein